MVSKLAHCHIEWIHDGWAPMSQDYMEYSQLQQNKTINFADLFFNSKNYLL